MKWMMSLFVVVVASCVAPIYPDCNSDGDCPVRCEEGDPFVDGLCTLTCERNEDCPGGTLCIDLRGGLCMIECTSQAQCDGMGRAWDCRDVEDTRGDIQLACLGR